MHTLGLIEALFKTLSMWAQLLIEGQFNSNSSIEFQMSLCKGQLIQLKCLIMMEGFSTKDIHNRCIITDS